MRPTLQRLLGHSKFLSFSVQRITLTRISEKSSSILFLLKPTQLSNLCMAFLCGISQDFGKCENIVNHTSFSQFPEVLILVLFLQQWVHGSGVCHGGTLLHQI